MSILHKEFFRYLPARNYIFFYKIRTSTFIHTAHNSAIFQTEFPVFSEDQSNLSGRYYLNNVSIAQRKRPSAYHIAISKNIYTIGSGR